MQEPWTPEPETPLEQALLGGPRAHRRAETSDLSGLDEETGRRLWRALGFPEVDEDTVMFTDGDVQALSDVRALAERQAVPIDTAVTIARTMAQACARLAQTEIAAMTEVVAARAADAGTTDLDALRSGLVSDAEEIVEVLERLLVHVWRRHLAAAAGRTFDALAGGTDSPGRDVLAVGFIDLVGFTALSRRASESELALLVERFESETSDRVAGTGGRVVKTIGDEVLFTHPDVRAAVELALDTAATHAGDDSLPDVRVGVAHGGVILRHGDVYGSVVNLASRLTSVARPGTVLVDAAAAACLDGAGGLRLRTLASRKVRGYDHLAPVLVRRADSRA